MILEQKNKKKEDRMKVTEFARLICEKEGKKKQVSIAQIMEILKVIKEMFNKHGMSFYGIIHDIIKD